MANYTGLLVASEILYIFSAFFMLVCMNLFPANLRSGKGKDTSSDSIWLCIASIAVELNSVANRFHRHEMPELSPRIRCKLGCLPKRIVFLFYVTYCFL